MYLNGLIMWVELLACVFEWSHYVGRVANTCILLQNYASGLE